MPVVPERKSGGSHPVDHLHLDDVADPEAPTSEAIHREILVGIARLRRLRHRSLRARIVDWALG